MQKLVLVILILGFVSCKKYEILSQPLNYKDYQSSIDTTFNYLEDIKDWEGINIYFNEDEEENI